MRKLMSFLLALLLVASTFMGVFVGNIQAHSIVVDGDPNDWLADSSGQLENTGMYYPTGEYVWVDAVGDDVGDGDYTYPTDLFFLPGMVDIKEFRVTYDDSRIYFLIKLGNITNAWNAPEGFCGILATIHIDQDRIPASGQEWAAQSMDSKFDSSCWWEYVIVLHGFGSWIMDSRWNTVGGTGNGMQVAGSVDNNCIEVAVDYSVIGSFVGQTWRFMVEVGFEEYASFREVQETVGGWAPGGGVPAGDNDWVESDAFDACFYTSTESQAEDWSDYNQSTGAPTIFCNTGEGFMDISSVNISFIREVSKPVQLTTSPRYDRDACFLIDKHGTYWLFFTRGRGDPSAPGYNPDTDFYDIYYLKSTDGGLTWTEYSMPDFVNDPYGQREVAAYEIPEIDTIAVFFTDAFYSDPYGTPTYGVYYTYTNDGGASWASVRQVPGVTATHIDVLNAYGKRWLFFEGTDSIIYVTYCEAGTWSAPIQISESGKHGGIPKAMIDKDGVFNVVWCGWTEGGIYRATSTDGITWSTPQLILTSSYIACDPVLVQDSDGTYWLFWAPWDSATDSQWLEVVYSPDGVTWSSSIHVTSGGYNGNYWWDFWSEAYLTPEGDILLFYTSEVATGSYMKGDGNIWMYKIDWDLKNPHYEFIQNAINAANPGDTIIVHEGVYNEKLVIDKQLTVEGVNRDSVIISGSGLSEKGVSVESDNVILRSMTVRDFTSGDWPWGVELVGASHCIIEDLVVCNCSSGGINLYRGCHNNIVRNNLIKYCDGNGISIYGSDKGCWYNLIENNEIIDCAFAETGGGTYRVPAICVFSNASYNTVRGNIIRQEAYAGKGRGIVLWGSTYGGSDMAETGNVIENNFVKNFDIGIYIIGVNPYTGTKNLVTDTTVRYNNLTKNNVGFKQIGFEGDYSPITLHHNNIYDNHDYGALIDTTYGTAILDARFNWWGDASGPSGMGPGVGDAISENVTYSPWLGYPYGTIPMTYHVDPTGKIQDAINDANPGDTIKVHEGTYTEQLIINKSLTLVGDPMPKIVAPDTRATFTIPESSATFDPIIFAYGSLTGTETISVTIEGFEIDGGNKAASGYRFVGILYRNVKPGVISNNVLHSLYPPSGKGSGPETVGILIYGDSEVEIYQNEIRDFSRVGIGASGDAGPNIDPVVIIRENTVFGNGLEPETDWWAENGIQVGYGATGYIVDNRVFNCTVNNPNWAASGILIVDTDGVTVDSNYIEGCDIGIGAVDFPSAYGPPWDYHILSNILITGNTLIENSWQIDISNDARNITVTYNDIINATGNGIDVWSYFGDVYPTNVEIHYNNIEGSGGYGIWASEELANQPVDARFNWWGDPTGPYHNTTWTYKGEPYGPHYGLGDRVSDYVLYDPWLVEPFVPPPIHDLAVLDITPSTTRIIEGETVQINVTVKNEGNVFENATVTLFYDSNIIDTATVIELAPGATEQFTFYWSTAGLSYGVYTLNASISTVPGETETVDNTKSIDVKVGPLAILKVEPSLYTAKRLNETFAVNVTISNLWEGWEIVGIQFRLSYNNTLLEVVNVTAGPFMEQFGDYFFTYYVEEPTDGWPAHTLVGILLLPPWTNFPSGDGVLATITLRVIYQPKALDPETAPSLTCDLALFDVKDIFLVDKDKQIIRCNLQDGVYEIRPNHKCDVNWDYYVGIDDITYAAEHFGSDPIVWPDRWDPECDINGDNYVGIDDIVLVASNFGWIIDP